MIEHLRKLKARRNATPAELIFPNTKPRNLVAMMKEKRDKMWTTKEAIATIGKALTGSGKTQGSRVNDVCPSCGARVMFPRPSF